MCLKGLITNRDECHPRFYLEPRNIKGNGSVRFVPRKEIDSKFW